MCYDKKSKVYKLIIPQNTVMATATLCAVAGRLKSLSQDFQLSVISGWLEQAREGQIEFKVQQKDPFSLPEEPGKLKG